jgi:hypothetical protein
MRTALWIGVRVAVALATGAAVGLVGGFVVAALTTGATL